jgi:hypothetical protein
MPVLRYDTGNPGATLISGVGDALANALNPKTRAEAYLLQQHLMLQNLQYQQELRKQAAQQTAISQYGHIVPPDQMPMITNMIYQGAPIDDINRQAALSSGQLIDAATPEAYAHNREYYIRVFRKLPEDGLIDAGPNTLAANNQVRAQQAGAVAGATTSGQQIATQTAIANPVPGYIQGQADIEKAKAAGAKQGDVSVMGLPLNEPRVLPYNPLSSDQITKMGAKVMPDGSVQIPAAVSYGRPTTILRPLGNGQYQFGQMPGEADAAVAYQKANEGALQDASSTSKLQAANKLGAQLDQLQDITGAIKSYGSGQIPAAVLNAINTRWGTAFTDKQSLIKQAKQILTTEIAQARQELGIKYLAGPEMPVAQAAVGSPTDPPDAIARVIGNNRADIQAALDQGTDAQKVLRGQMSYDDYIALNNQRGANLGQHQKEYMDDSLNRYRDAGALPKAPAAPVTQQPVPAPVLSPPPPPVVSSTQPVPPVPVPPAPVPVPPASEANPPPPPVAPPPKVNWIWNSATGKAEPAP